MAYLRKKDRRRGSELDIVEEVMSISNLQKIESFDGFMEVSELMESDNPSKEEIIEIKSYLNNNKTLASRINSKNGDFQEIT